MHTKYPLRIASILEVCMLSCSVVKLILLVLHAVLFLFYGKYQVFNSSLVPQITLNFSTIGIVFFFCREGKHNSPAGY